MFIFRRFFKRRHKTLENTIDPREMDESNEDNNVKTAALCRGRVGRDLSACSITLDIAKPIVGRGGDR
jgi:hypothetical protein